MLNSYDELIQQQQGLKKSALFIVIVFTIIFYLISREKKKEKEKKKVDKERDNEDCVAVFDLLQHVAYFCDIHALYIYYIYIPILF